MDDDGILDGVDNCPTVYNTGQEDTDEDGIGNACDADSCDSTPDVARAINKNGHYRARASPCDGGCSIANPANVSGWRYASIDERETRPAQSDFMISGSLVCAAAWFDDRRTHCDYGNPEARIPQGGADELWLIYDCTNIGDADIDGILDDADNCPSIANTDQADNDDDGLGDLCDPDDDNDTINDSGSCVPDDDFVPNFKVSTTRSYSSNTACTFISGDNCQFVANTGQEDSNQNGIGDACDDLCLNIEGVQSTVPAGYTVNSDKQCTPIPSQGGGGGGGGGSLLRDSCPNGDNSPSFYDGSCGSERVVEITSSGEVENNLLSGGFSQEFVDAYQRAFANGLTNADTIENADMDGLIIRSQMAKMISLFAINMLGKIPDTSKSCTFSDITKQTTETKGYIVQACQLGLMGYHTDGISKKAKFEPNAYVDRAQFGTLLSRLLFGAQYNGGDPFYIYHLTALQAAAIMSNIDSPFAKELRGYVMIMLMRSAGI